MALANAIESIHKPVYAGGGRVHLTAENWLSPARDNRIDALGVLFVSGQISLQFPRHAVRRTKTGSVPFG